MTCEPIQINPIAGTIGAEIFGVDLTQPLSEGQFEHVHEALLEHLVIFIPGQQPLAVEDLKRFAMYFGELDYEPFVFPFKLPVIEGHPELYENIKEASNDGINLGGFWHADVTYREKPHKASILYAKDVPAFGGDTMFANQYLAYETLPKALKEKLLDMQAVHSSAMPHGQTASRFASVGRNHVPEEQAREFNKGGQTVAEVTAEETVHPVIRTHPKTGRPLLYLNRGFTSHFVGMSPEQSLPLLEELWAHASRPEFTCRYRWTPNTVGIWDNCATQHYAINDYFGERRHMQRISIHED